MSEVLQAALDILMDMCVPTEELARTSCARCGGEFTPSKFTPKNKQRYCGDCNKHRHAARDMETEIDRGLKMVLANIAYRNSNRDRYLSFDGKYEGPTTESFVWVGFKKDKGYHPMPVDVHCEPEPAKFNFVTSEDVAWADKQSAFAHTYNMPRAAKNFCPVCVDMVIDKTVRVTKGVYLPIKHECGMVRVYNLQGKLLEVKPL